MNNATTFKPLPDPQLLAEETADLIAKTIKQESNTENMLAALQLHYETLHKSQEMYIDYLTDFVGKLKTAQQKDKESLSTLKKEVLRHVLDLEKDKNRV